MTARLSAAYPRGLSPALIEAGFRFAVALAALLLLVYVGFVEAQRGNDIVLIDELHGLGHIIESHLGAAGDKVGAVDLRALLEKIEPVVPGLGIAAKPGDTPGLNLTLQANGTPIIVTLAEAPANALRWQRFMLLTALALGLALLGALLGQLYAGRIGWAGRLARYPVLVVSVLITIGIGQALVAQRLDSLGAEAAALRILLAADIAETGHPPVSTYDKADVSASIGPEASPSWQLAPPLSLGDGRQIVIGISVAALLSRPDLQHALRNFAILLVASTFLVRLFGQIAATLRQHWGTRLGLSIQAPEIGEATLDMVRPIFFMAMLIENMGYIFLPALLKSLVAAAGLPPGIAGAVFMTYFFGFALILVPAGQMAGRYGPKALIIIGAILVALGMAAMVLSMNVWLAAAARFMVGVGQGMMLIGVQSAILEVAAVGHRTQGAAIIVNGFNNAMISGIALGSLLVGAIGARGIFLLSTVLALGILAFTHFLLPALTPPPHIPRSFGRILRDLGGHTGRALASGAFIRTTFLIGIPNKAVLTGVILFALPLLLGQQGIGADTIGQIIMCYPAGMLITSPIVSRLVDRRGKTGSVLLIGSFVSGLGLVTIGCSGWSGFNAYPHHDLLVMGLLIAAVLMIGMAHGFVNAPIVTHVSDLPIARELGPAQVAATYRFLERLGHVAGPIIMGQILALGGNHPSVILWVGAGITLFAILFQLPMPTRRTAIVRPPHPSGFPANFRADADPHRH